MHKLYKIEAEILINREGGRSWHIKTGSRALQSSKKTVFGDLNSDQVQQLVRDAYKNVSKKLQTQGDRIKVRGSSGGYTIDMWINKATNTIETAYPIIH